MKKLIVYSDELYHHGIKGQKWGVRRYQNKDGTLTARGRIHQKLRTKYEDSKLSLSNKRSARYEASVHKEVKNMSDVELANAIARLQMEKRYIELRSDDIMAGKAATRGVVTEYGWTFAKRSGGAFTNDLAKNTGKKLSRKIVPLQKDK